MSVFSEDSIRKCLFVDIPEIIIKESLDSTNTYLKEYAKNGAKENTVVIAKSQTNGRGRTGNSFFSPNGGLYMSVLLKPVSGIENFITAFAAVAVCRAIEKVTKKAPEIKWVNDIYLDRKKICGILTEGSVNPDGCLANIILGIGINISLSPSTLPEDIKNKAGALYEAESEPENIKNILTAEILNCLLPILGDENYHLYIEEYKKRCMLFGKTITYTKNNSEYQGIVTGIDDNLHLEVKNTDGKNVVLSSGEIKITGWE